MIIEKWKENSTTIIRVLAVCGIILVLFTVIGFLTGILGKGMRASKDQVVSVADAVYRNYDNTTVSGNEVTSALKSYANAGMSVIVATSYVTNGDVTATSLVAPNFGILADQSHNAGDPIGKVPTAKVSYSENTQHWYLGEKAEKGKYGLDYSGDQWLRFADLSCITDSNQPAVYISGAAKFRANLLYDPQTDTVCGVFFLQVQ